MTHNFVFNTDCFASQIRETQHNTKHTLSGKKPLSLSFHWRIILFMIFSSMMLSPFESNGQTDTLICDNGGFEDGFLYYSGSAGNFSNGSNLCTPLSQGNPITFTSTSIPSSRRFEIVSSGNDDLVGINKTKFGEKAVRINHKYGHDFISNCNGLQDVNKLTKRFKVTEENREFTIWFAAVLEYPTNPSHNNNQPFFSIKCNLASTADLCFDSDLLNCPQTYTDALCTFVPIKVLDWSCHQIKISQDKIGQIATLDILVGDCGQSDHFGYAYIDGICEECTGSSLGYGKLYDQELDENGLGIDYYSCEGDKIKVCGDYTIPSICGNWRLDSIKVPGFEIQNLEIDTINHIFCFELLRTNFETDSCRKLFVEYYFSNGTLEIPTVFSNTIEICYEDFIAFEVNEIVGSCQNNGTNNIISDDYYYVNVIITNINNNSWIIERILDNPYNNESGNYIIKSGTGNGTFSLGPLQIQEGGWTLKITINGCIKYIHIVAPIYCSATCPVFNETKITNITCDNQGNNDPTNDTWSFKLEVVSNQNGYFYIDNNSNVHINFNTVYPSSGQLISDGCKEFKLTWVSTNSQCNVTIIVCPPKPCSNNTECNLEAYINDIRCNQEDNQFNFNLIVSPTSGGYTCYQSISRTDGANVNNSNNRYGNISNLGTFTEDIYIKVFKCSTSICTCANDQCFKFIYVPKPDCSNLNFRIQNEDKIGLENTKIWIIPNPVKSDEFIIQSNFNLSSIEIVDINSKIIYQSILEGKEFRITLNLPKGVYFVRFHNKEGIYRYVKFIKL